MSIYGGAITEFMKLATSVKLPSGGEIQLKAPSMRHISAMRDPGSAGYVKPATKVRIAGGAKNVGFTSPPTISSGASAASKANSVRTAAGRRLTVPLP